MLLQASAVTLVVKHQRLVCLCDPNLILFIFHVQIKFFPYSNFYILLIHLLLVMQTYEKNFYFIYIYDKFARVQIHPLAPLYLLCFWSTAGLALFCGSLFPHILDCCACTSCLFSSFGPCFSPPFTALQFLHPPLSFTQ